MAIDLSGAKSGATVIFGEASKLSGDVAFQRSLLPYKAVKLELLDRSGDWIREGQGVRVASGFLVEEGDSTYLYTCWHVVTHIALDRGARLPGAAASGRPAKVRVLFQGSEEHAPAVQMLSGKASVVADLVDDSSDIWRPLWEQDDQYTPNPELEMAGLRQPFWHDVVRLKIGGRGLASPAQLVDLSDFSPHHPGVGDDVWLVGYPYGYSAFDDQPTPIVLRRSIAAQRFQHGCRTAALLDGGGAGGMSGGPVFHVQDGKLWMCGLYSGVIFPDRGRNAAQGERATALGVFAWTGLLKHLELVIEPSKPVVAGSDPGDLS